jgi:hypothetical protein
MTLLRWPPQPSNDMFRHELWRAFRDQPLVGLLVSILKGDIPGAADWSTMKS